MTTSVKKGERRPRLQETGMSHDCQVKPDTQKEYFRVNILFPGGQISVRGRNRPNIKRSLGVFIIVLRLLHFWPLQSCVNSYVNSSKTVNPLSATLTLVQKQLYPFQGNHAVLYFPLYCQRNRNNDFKRIQLKYYFQEKKYLIQLKQDVGRETRPACPLRNFCYSYASCSRKSRYTNLKIFSVYLIL